MFANHKKLIVGGCLSSVILLCLVFGIWAVTGINSTKQSFDYLNQLPRRTVDIAIDASRRQELFDQLRKFAAKNGFGIQIINQDGMPPDYFFIDMNRRDIRINGLNLLAPQENPTFPPVDYELGFYDVDQLRPAADLIYDILVNDLQSFISGVPGSTFSVAK
jgi:hypothetical protein